MVKREFDEIDRLCARRAQDAMEKYGILDLLNDPRDFVKELREELLDAINYTRWANVKGRIPNDNANGIIWVLKCILKCNLPKEPLGGEPGPRGMET